MNILRLSVIISSIFLSACTILSPQADYIPEDNVLKNAVVGIPYLTKIDIVGGRVMGGWYRPKPNYKPGYTVPDDVGIYLRNCLLPAKESDPTIPTKNLYNGNCIEIYGTPTKPGVIKINISGQMYGNMIAPANHFSKDYTLNVVKP